MLKAKAKSTAKVEAVAHGGTSPEKKEHKKEHQSTLAEHIQFILKAPSFQPSFQGGKPETEATAAVEILVKAMQPVIVPASEEHQLEKARAILKHPHRFVRRVRSIAKQITTKNHTVHLGEALKQGVSVLVGNPLAQRLRICSQLVDALIHLRDLKLLFLDLHEGYLSVQDNLLEVQIDCFYKHSMKEDSPDWTRIRAPELINDKLIVGDHASHDYSSADVWSLANLLIGILWDPSARLAYSTTDSTHKYFVSNEQALQITADIRLPELKIPNSTQLIQLLEKCLAFNPKRRPNLEAIQQCLDDATQTPHAPYQIFDELLHDVQTIKHSSLTHHHQSEPTLLSKDIIKFAEPIIEHTLKGRKVHFRLVFQASEYQFRADAFHHCCDKLNNLLLVCKATNGKIFGGFSSESWEGKNGLFGCYKPSNSVLFSFSNRTVHRLKIKDHAVGCQPSMGPIFGTADLVLGDCNISNICMFPMAYKLDEPEHRTNDHITLTGGSSFTLEEYEVYSTHFDG